MGKAKGKVNEKSLEALKKSIKAGGKSRQGKDAKPATPRGQTQPRSRSRSRTPTRAKKTPPPPKKEKKVPVKKPTVTPKVKRLEDDKPAAKRPRGRPSTKTPGSYKLRPRIQPSDDEISSSTRTHEEASDAFNDRSVSKGKVQSSAAVDANRGWFSKCIIS